MRTVYVITDAQHPLRHRVRNLLAAVTTWVLVALSVVGHTLAVLAGAVDALVTAALGTRRIGYLSGQLRDVVRESWKEDL